LRIDALVEAFCHRLAPTTPTMKTMDAPSLPGTRGRLEHGIEALLPPARQRPIPPVPLALPALVPLRSRPSVTPFVLDMAHLDASGRFTSRPATSALRWLPGQPLEMTVTDEAVIFTPATDGTAEVGSRSEIAVPAPAKVTAGLDRTRQVALVAVPDQAMLIVHPPALLAALLAEHYASGAGDGS
jgi:hypothetical protein